MNQGNDPSHAGDDGVYHDGCLVFRSATNKWQAFYFAFQSQSFETDDNTGHPVGDSAVATKPSKGRAGKSNAAKETKKAKGAKAEKGKSAKKAKKGK